MPVRVPAGCGGNRTPGFNSRGSFSAGAEYPAAGRFAPRLEENVMLITDRLRTYFRRTLRGLWLSRAFRKLWLSLTITSFGAQSVELLFGVGFLCGVQNVVGGAAYQVLLAQMAGRKRLVEANAKISLGETSAALIGPGMAGGLIQALTAPFAIALDAFGFFVSALMLRRVRAPTDVPHPGSKSSVTAEIIA